MLYSNSANTSKTSKNTTKNTSEKFNLFILILCSKLWTHWYVFVDIHIKNLWAKEPEFPSWPVWHSRRIPTSWCPDLRMDLFIFMSFQILTLFTHWGTFHYYIVKPMRLRHCKINCPIFPIQLLIKMLWNTLIILDLQRYKFYSSYY